MDFRQLASAITSCPEIPRARMSANHPCAKIVGLQREDAFQSPEPWRGHIETAPILFVSSNPSIGGEYTFPPSGWSDEQVVSYYLGCFDHHVEGRYQVDERRFARVQFWREVRARASELLGRPAVQGEDFAITEVVHCKSTREQGVKEALELCVQRWMEPVIERCAAKVIVVLGSYARRVCSACWNLDGKRRVHFDVSTPGKDRTVVLLPHPNAREKRKLLHHTTDQERLRLRSQLAAEARMTELEEEPQRLRGE